MRTVIKIFLKVLHGVLLGVCIFLALFVVIMAVLAIGIPGSWLNPIFDKYIPAEAGALRIERIAIRPNGKVIITKLDFSKGDHCYGAVAKAEFEFRIFSFEPFFDRLSAVTLDTLYVAQIKWPEGGEGGDEQRVPFPDLSQFPIPRFKEVALTVIKPNVLEVTLDYASGFLSTTDDQLLHIYNVKGHANRKIESAEATLDIDIHDAKMKAHIRGQIYQQRLNGIYRALNFPLIETFSNKFVLNAPAWGDANFIVAFDKWRELFHLTVDIVSFKGGSYCGVPFDEAQGTITCSGVFDAVTTIYPLIAKRDGKTVATGRLVFDLPKDKFFFKAEGKGLMPEECFQLIDMPFTKQIPAITAKTPPALTFEGDIPLFSEQAPEFVNFTGTVKADDTIAVDRFAFASGSCEMVMNKGVLNFNNVIANLPTRGKISGNVEIQIPHSAEYADIHSYLDIEKAALPDLLTPYDIYVLPNTSADGSLDLSCRVDQNIKQSINGHFNFIFAGGLIGRIPLFAGFTDIMAKYFPPLKAVTDTSTAHVNGIVEKGLIQIPAFSLTGAVFSIEGPVNYDIDKDEIDAAIIGGVFKKGSVAGFATRWFLIPFTKLLLQINVSGSVSDPQWHVISVVEKIFGD